VKAWANDPNPPRETPPSDEPDEELEEELEEDEPDDASPPKKLDRDDEPPE
jgi:hypothetical protein